MKEEKMTKVVLGRKLTIEEFMAVVRFHAEVDFSPEYRQRVERSRKIVETCVEEERVVYGTTTGFGALVTKTIGKEDAEKLQRNIILTHSTSVGEPFKEEEVRAIILMVLQSLGMGMSGVRMELLEHYRDFLNKNLIPCTPREGSVGYLCAEGHIAAALIGEGRMYYRGELSDSRTALRKAGMEPLAPSYKEGLALLNGTSSPTALAAMGIYDLLKAVESADVVAAMSFEMLNGLLR
ncbi:aromatic amino acid ammonia-lyase, partial [Blautia pseudococcoides]|nr:aromatic amino acid ammonia-lyase [Blautia pseudococcoides]